MSANDATVLVVATTPPNADALSWVAERFRGRSIVAVYLSDDAEAWPIGDGWQRLLRRDLEDLSRLRREFLEFVEAWPRQTFRATAGKTFDEAFRRGDGYSLWWTGPGLARHPDQGIFLQLRDIWSIAAAIERVRCADFVLLSKDAEVARVVADRCTRDGIGFAVPPGCAAPQPAVWPSRWRFALSALAKYLMSPWVEALRAFVCRRRVRRKRESPADRHRPAIVATAQFPREFRRDADGPQIAFWREVAAELHRRDAGLRIRYLLHTTADRLDDRGLDRLHCHRAWTELRGFDALAPLPNETVGWKAWLRAAEPFLRTLLRYVRLEGHDDFRASFRFAGCDVAPLYAPLLRKAIVDTLRWSQNVASYEASLRAVDNVRAVLVYGEMYALGMPVIAAARNLGIVTIGVQHGTIFPMHLVYALPPGQIAGSPTPDWFAAYGDYTRQTLSEQAAFPQDRVLVVGAPRLDGLATAPVDRIATRGGLDLPPDKHVVLFATQVYPWFRTAARALFEAVRDRQDVLVCVKTHPLERTLDDYRRLAAEAGATNVRFFADQFDALLAACDVLVSGSSTATLEAILAGKGTICVNFSGEPDRYPYVADGGSLGAANAEELRAAIDRALDAKEQPHREVQRQAFLRRHVGPSATGQAAAAFVDAVLERAGLTPAAAAQSRLD